MANGDVDTLVLGAVNTCWRDPIDLPTLLSLLRSSQAPGRWQGPVRQLFADVPLPALVRFAERHQLSRRELGSFYARHIASRRDVNPDVEAWLRG